MAGLRFTDVQARPTEFLDVTSLTLDEFQQLVPPFEAAFQAHLAVWRLDGKPRRAWRCWGLRYIRQLLDLHVKHGQNISYIDAEIIGSYFEEMLQTLQRLVWRLWSVSPRHLCQFLAQNKIRFFPHWRNACPGQVSPCRGTIA